MKKTITGTIGAIYELRKVTPTATKQRFMLRSVDEDIYFIEAFNNIELLSGLMPGDAVKLEISSKEWNGKIINYLNWLSPLLPVEKLKVNDQTISKNPAVANIEKAPVILNITDMDVYEILGLSPKQIREHEEKVKLREDFPQGLH
ncbi:MAG: hypothetical protein IPK08_06220 [Bacteroidetes bacterium]|nr:hypothetical protein [Bacteroidota bacterium]